MSRSQSTERQDHLTIRLAGEEVVLDRRRAMYWPRESALILTDLHLGKIQHFRKAGISIPSQASESNWTRLDELMSRYEVKQLTILGDLFHSRQNKAWDRWVGWTLKHSSTDIHLIRGNHDILPEHVYREISNVNTHPILRTTPFIFTHFSPDEPDTETYSLSGHLHPGIRLSGRGKQSLTFPCFYFDDHGGVLPAFGKFTGLHIIQAREGSRIYAISEGQVISCH